MGDSPTSLWQPYTGHLLSGSRSQGDSIWRLMIWKVLVQRYRQLETPRKVALWSVFFMPRTFTLVYESLVLRRAPAIASARHDLPRSSSFVGRLLTSKRTSS